MNKFQSERELEIRFQIIIFKYQNILLLTLVEAVGGKCWPSDDKLENWTETSSPCRHLQVTS